MGRDSANTHSATGTSVDTPYPVGSVLLGKYRIEQVIGTGGMGLVLGATHVALQQRVAIKILLPTKGYSQKVEARFLREAQAAASLRSENVVRVFDVGRMPDQRPYMVMEWLDGQDLSRRPMGAELPIEEAVDYVMQACDAMSVAHMQNLVHRDLKPANLFLINDEHGVPTIKVLDFGISKLRTVGSPISTLTDADGLMGSPSYMSPEQIRSARDVDVRADIWALGTILYELLTGSRPFQGEDIGAVFYAISQEQPRAITELRTEVPPEVDRIVRKCLEKQPALRYERAQELQQELLPYASARCRARLSMRSPPAATSPGSVPLMPQVSGSRKARLGAGRGRVRPLALALASASSGVVALLALSALRTPAHNAASTATADGQENSSPSATPAFRGAPASSQSSAATSTGVLASDVHSRPLMSPSATPPHPLTSTTHAGLTRRATAPTAASQSPVPRATSTALPPAPSTRNPLDMNFK